MFDNLGFGEIAMLALMALLFFGPERLPQIGARVGHWIATLTQSSKAFMNEWREEALVVYDAVEEVRGIRDEIVAARAEIAGTVTTARDDVNDALSGARSDVQAQVRGATTFSPTSDSGDADTSQIPRVSAGQWVGTDGSTENPPSSPPLGGTPDRAIDRTSEILADLRQKRGKTEPTAIPPEPPSSTTFSDANPLNQSAQHLWHQTAPRAKKQSRTEPQPIAASSSSDGTEQRNQHPSPSLGAQAGKKLAPPTSPTLASLRETITALASDVQILRDELARTRAELSMGSEANPRAEPNPTIPKTAPTPHPQPVHTGEQAGEQL